MEPGGSLPSSQKHATVLFNKQNQPNPCPQTLFHVHSNIIYSSIYE